ncbi:MAG TPA: hypothetical protein VGD74_05005, partial [Vulgatibacter sp.]
MTPILIAVFLATTVANPTAPGSPRIDRVRVVQEGGRTSIELVGAGAASFTTSLPSDALIVDLFAAKLAATCELKGAAGPVRGLRCEQQGKGVRVEVAMLPDAEARLESRDGSLVIDVGPGLGADAQTAEAAALARAKAEEERQAVEAAALAQAKAEAERRAAIAAAAAQAKAEEERRAAEAAAVAQAKAEEERRAAEAAAAAQTKAG